MFVKSISTPLVFFLCYLIESNVCDEILSISSSSSPIILEHPPEKVIVAAQDPVTLNCKAEGFPAPSIHWFRNGQPLSVNSPRSHRIILPDGSLFFLKTNSRPGYAGSEDEGVYWCSASNEHGTAVSRNSTLTVAYINSDFRVVPRSMEGILDSSISLNCIPPAGLPTPVVRWKKNQEYLDLSSSHRILILASGTLKINPLQEDDAGEYTCSASNLAGTKETDPVMLKVLRPPSFLQSPRNVTVISGNDVILECIGDGDPLPKISWTKGTRSGIDTKYEKRIPGQGLKLRNVHPAQEGLYTCTASSAIGTKSSSAYVSVIEPPLIVAHSPRSLTAPSLGSLIELECAAEGRPPPVLLWMREDDRTILLPGDSTDTLEVTRKGTLVVKATTDTSHYICLAVNNAGAAVARSTVHLRSSFMENDFVVVRGVKVDVTQIQGLSSSSIKVTWRLSKDATSDLVDGFYILYRCRRGFPAGFTSITVLHAGATSYVVNRLEPHTPYEFLVVPFQRGFSGHPSSLFVAWTLESLPTEAPTELSWAPINGSAVNVSWRHLDDVSLRGELKGYQLMILQNGQIASNRSLDKSQSWLTMSNLEPFHTYEIQVAAFNSIGLGPFSPPIRVKPEPSSMYKGAAISDSSSTAFNSEHSLWLLGFFATALFLLFALGSLLLYKQQKTCRRLARSGGFLHKKSARSSEDLHREFQMIPSSTTSTTETVWINRRWDPMKESFKSELLSFRRRSGRSSEGGSSELKKSKKKRRHSKHRGDSNSSSSSSESDSDYAYIDRSSHSITGRFIETDPSELPLSPYATTEVVGNPKLGKKKVAQRGTQTRRRRTRHRSRFSNSEDCLQPLSVSSLLDEGTEVFQATIGDSITDPELSDHIYTLVASRGASAAASLGSLTEAGKRKKQKILLEPCINLLDILPPPPSYPPPPHSEAGDSSGRTEFHEDEL